MLKLYKNTIIFCLFTMGLAIVISVLCEIFSKYNLLLIQNYAIGIACSLVVAIITTSLQYLHEHRRIFHDYCYALNDMVFKLSFAYYISEEDESNNADFFEKLAKDIDSSIECFDKLDLELQWFSSAKKRLQENVYMRQGKLCNTYKKQRLISKKNGVISLKGHENFIDLIQASISIFPDGLMKDLFEEDYKEILSQKSTS